MTAEEDPIYLIHTDPGRVKGFCTLGDERVVLCSFRRMVDAMAVAAGRDDLRVVRRSELGREERRRVDEAFGR